MYDSGSPVEDRQSIITAGGRRKRNCSPTRCWYARFPVFVEIVVDSTHGRAAVYQHSAAVYRTSPSSYSILLDSVGHCTHKALSMGMVITAR